MDDEYRDLLNMTAETLDEGVSALSGLVSELEARTGEERLDTLRGLAQRSYDRDEEFEIREGLCYYERKLLWAWARLTYLRALRRDIGRGSMMNSSPRRNP